MDEIGLSYRYLDDDLEQPQVRTEYETMSIDHEQETVQFPFSPAGAQGDDQLVLYLEDHDSADYLRPLDSYDDPEAELNRRLPELSEMMDETSDLYDTVVQTFCEDVPQTYWTRPSSATGFYHPPDERQMHGQWIHTKRVLQNTATLQRSAIEMETKFGLDEDQKNQLGAAAALHDIAKYGKNGESGHVTDDHATIAVEILDTVLDEQTHQAIRRHDGPWAEDDPETMTDLYTHIADMTAAQTAQTSLLYKPNPACKFTDLAQQLTEIEPDTAFYTVSFQRP